MIITCKIPQNVPYKDANGVVQLCALRTGSHNYPAFKPKEDPLLAATLFVLRKHKQIAFDGSLPQDLEPGAKPELKPKAAGRVVNEKSESQKREEGKRAAEKVKIARGHRKENPKAGAAGKDSDKGGEPGGVSDKK